MAGTTLFRSVNGGEEEVHRVHTDALQVCRPPPTYSTIVTDVATTSQERHGLHPAQRGGPASAPSVCLELVVHFLGTSYHGGTCELREGGGAAGRCGGGDAACRCSLLVNLWPSALAPQIMPSAPRLEALSL